MSFGGSDRHSTETLGEGVSQLKRQQCKVEMDSADKASMEKELKDTVVSSDVLGVLEDWTDKRIEDIYS